MRSVFSSWGTFAVFMACVGLAVYFAFAAVQGDYGLFRRAEIIDDNVKLENELKILQAEVSRMENLTKRMSDDYLDLDLLDQQARDILGYVGASELVVR